MPLTANAMPGAPPLNVAPFDADACFGMNANFQTLTGSAYMGAPAQIDIGLGRVEGLWAVNLTALDMTTGDENYTVFLLGSNDVAWANGNVEILQAQNFGGATGRSIATIVGATLPIGHAASGRVGTQNYFPFSNGKGGLIFRYVRVYCVLSGITPSITLNSWLSYKA